MTNLLTDLSDKVTPAHTAIVVIDMQNDFCDPNGVLAKRGTAVTEIRAMIPRLQRFLDIARTFKVRIVHVRTERTESSDSDAVRELWLRKGVTQIRSLLKGSWGAEFVPELIPHEGELVVTKSRYDAFINTNLETQLKSLGVRTIIGTGVATHVCVESTCRHAFMIDFYVVVPRDLVACGDNRAHEVTLANLETYFAKVTSADDIIRCWQGGTSGDRH